MQIFTLEHQRRSLQCDAVRLLSSHCRINWFKNAAGNIYLKISNQKKNQIMHCFFAIKLLKISMFFFSKSKQKISTTTTSAVFQQLKLPIVCIDVPYSRSSHLGFGCIVMQSVFSVQCTPPSFKHPISGSPPSLTSSSSKEREREK